MSIFKSTKMLNVENPEERAKRIRKIYKKSIIYVLVVLVLLVSIYNFMNSYKILEYKNIPNGINVVETEDDINFKVNMADCGIISRYDIIKTENDIEYVKYYICIIQKRGDLLFGKTKENNLFKLTKDGFEVGVEPYKRSDSQGNIHEIRRCIKEVYYQVIEKDENNISRKRVGDPVLIWKLND